VNIIENGFKLPEKIGMFGKGIYFATDSSKSDNYAPKENNQDQTMLLCKIALGKVMTLTTACPFLTHDTVLKEYDSVYAIRNSEATQGVKYDEYVIYHIDQILPLYIIKYHAFYL
jgi:hypothetical protein